MTEITQIERALEALLFAAAEPLSVEDLARRLRALRALPARFAAACLARHCRRRAVALVLSATLSALGLPFLRRREATIQDALRAPPAPAAAPEAPAAEATSRVIDFSQLPKRR